MTNNDGEALEEIEKQDIGIITMQEFETYKKVELFQGRMHHLSEKIRMYQGEVYQNTVLSGIGVVGGGVAFALAETGLGIAGLGIAVLTGLFSYVNCRRANKCERRFESNKTELERLEKGQLYQSFESKVYEKE